MMISRPGSRQRLLDALDHRFTGEVPFLETWVADNAVDWVMQRPMGGKHMLQLEPSDYVEFVQRTGMDAGYIYAHWPLGRKNKVDEKGRVHYVDGTIKSPADFGQIELPSLDEVRRPIEQWLAAAEAADLGCMFALNDAPSLATTAIGPIDSLLAMVDAPAFLDEFMDRVEEFTLPQVRCAMEYPIDAFWMTAPQCGKGGPIVSPELHERFIFPRIEKMMEMIRPSGIPVILHTDGDNSVFMDWILDAGFAGLHPIEPGSPRYDIYDLKQRHGERICLCGNIDVAGVLSFGTADEVRADVLEHLERLAPGAGYICGSSHDITESIPLANFGAMVETICSYEGRKER